MEMRSRSDFLPFTNSWLRLTFLGILVQGGQEVNPLCDMNSDGFSSSDSLFIYYLGFLIDFLKVNMLPGKTDGCLRFESLSECYTKDKVVK